jgi:hypothetical protein
MAGPLLVSTRKGLFVVSKSPTSGAWEIESVHFLGDNITLAMADPRDGSWYAAQNLGHFGVKLKHSADRGRTWTERAVPAYPDGATVVMGDGKPPTPATMKLLWALEPGAAGQPGRLWAGTVPGGLFRSDDSGQSWQLVESLWNDPRRSNWFGGGYDQPGIHSICVDPRDPRALLLAVSCGGVWSTTDDGATWSLVGEGLIADFMPPDRQGDPSIQDVHRMVRCAASPDTLWVQHHNGIFRSTDNAKTFAMLPGVHPSHFGFAVAVHPSDARTAWFVPAIKDERRVAVDGQLCVTQTRDGGTTFVAHRTGLPQQHAYDIVLRHALDVDASGSTVAFGSTTGNLWISDTGGASWQEISHHLPPIHAVRWV